MSAMRATGTARRAGLSGGASSGPGTSARGAPMPLVEPWPKAKPPGEPDAAQHGGKRDRGPVRLLAVMRALQRPGAGDQAAGRRHAARQIADDRSTDAADRFRPFG